MVLRAIPGLAIAAVLAPVLADRPGVDPACVAPAIPLDCAERSVRIGEPPAAIPGEGWLPIVSPAVDPLVLVRPPGAKNGLLYALNPQANRVRVLDPANGLSVARDIDVCHRPSALAGSPDGAELYVACHASHAVAVIDTERQIVTALIQDRDADGRPLLQEPMGLVARGDRLYVASSQNHRLAVVDRAARRVLRFIELPGQDPRAMVLSPDGGSLIVANFAAGNRTEPGIRLHGAVFDPDTKPGAVCEPLLADPAARAVALEDGPRFMDTAHPDYPTIAECYFYAHAFGATDEVVINPRRADHDLVVVDLDTEQVVFTTDVLDVDPGTLNYGLAADSRTSRVYLVSTEARNARNTELGGRPVVNRLAVFDFDPAAGALSLRALHDLDAPFLDATGGGTSRAAIPHAVAVAGDRLLIAASGSDRLLVSGRDGRHVSTIPTGFAPTGLVVDGGVVHVYHAAGLGVSSFDVDSGAEIAAASIGTSPMPYSARLGARLFRSAALSSNGTVACASCHPDGHLDGLVWKLNERDGLRATMSLHEIASTAPYHWDGSKCSLRKIVEDTTVDLMGAPEAPSACEIAALTDYIEGLVRPHSPFRRLDGRLGEEAALGLAVFQRSRFKDVDDTPRVCSTRVQDMAAERLILEAVGDPRGRTFRFNGGGGPVANTRVSESCSVANCHVAPHWESDGFIDGDPSLGRISGFQAVSTTGAWDRMITNHDARTTRAALLEALEVNRAFHGAPPLSAGGHSTGTVAAQAFNDTHFRHVEFNFDDDPESHGFVLTDALTRFMLEDEQLQTGAVGLSVVLTPKSVADRTVTDVMARLRRASDQGKIAYRSVGTLGGETIRLTWQPGRGRFRAADARSLTPDELIAALRPGDAMTLYGALLPGQDPALQPKLRAVTRGGGPYLCSESYAEYHADVTPGEADVALTLHGIDVAPGTRVLVDGRITGAGLTRSDGAYRWVLPRAPEAPAVLAVQLLGPTGLQSNTLAVHVVPPVVAPLEPRDLELDRTRPAVARLAWSDQFGTTGPGTRYDVVRGKLDELDGTGLAAARCIGAALFRAEALDGSVPAPGEAFYYVVRAQNQAGISGWGTTARDAQVGASSDSCPDLFP